MRRLDAHKAHERLASCARHYGVAQYSKSVHPMGNPIIHSTNRGERTSPFLPVWERSASVSVTPSWLTPVDVVPLAVERESATVGVGHSFAAIPCATRVATLGVPALGRVELLPFWLLPYVDAVGVGSKEPPSISPMGRTNGGSFKSRPPAVIPERGQISDNAPGVSAYGGDVLKKNVGGSKLTDKSDDLPIKPRALAIQARAISRRADVLAWKPPGDDVDVEPFEFLRAKSGNVVPNWCFVQLTVGHPRHEHATSIRLDVIDD